jgi:GNAT superfamily N-acetyltransferase
MSDMLVKLYELEDEWRFLADQAKSGVIIRKPIGPEKQLILDWVTHSFSEAWASETDTAISNRPGTCFVALQDRKLIGFACYDATALGFFGPIGVDESFRGRGTGKALLLACLLDMKLRGYGYAIIGKTNDPEFYAQAVDAVEIPGSSSSVWKTWMRREGDP